MKTFSAKPHEVVHDWLHVDATDQVLGRLAAAVALRNRTYSDELSEEARPRTTTQLAVLAIELRQRFVDS